MQKRILALILSVIIMASGMTAFAESISYPVIAESTLGSDKNGLGNNSEKDVATPSTAAPNVEPSKKPTSKAALNSNEFVSAQKEIIIDSLNFPDINFRTEIKKLDSNVKHKGNNTSQENLLC